MSETEIVDDEEIVLRRIPPDGSKPARKIRGNHLKLRPGETGLSVSRDRYTSALQLLDLLPEAAIDAMGPPVVWRVAGASVRDIRVAGFDVIADRTDKDAGHALIVSQQASLDDQLARRDLSMRFAFVATSEVEE